MIPSDMPAVTEVSTFPPRDISIDTPPGVTDIPVRHGTEPFTSSKATVNEKSVMRHVGILSPSALVPSGSSGVMSESSLSG